MSRSRCSLLAVLGALALAACASGDAGALRKSPNYKAGYSDGCATADAQGEDSRAEPVRDDELYHQDKAYRQGWSGGFSACRQTGAMPPNPAAGPIPDRNPGGPLN